ncbi:MAG: DUF342 domain-containing protein, partial [Planctomycetes bacterium]|nr:DUF342 domain-containing protein [Planctomycetota bacterium]
MTDEQGKLLNWLRHFGANEGQVGYVAENFSNPTAMAAFRAFRGNNLFGTQCLYLDCVPSHFICISVKEGHLVAYLTLIGFKRGFPNVGKLIEGMISSLGVKRDANYESLLAEAEKNDHFSEPWVDKVFIEGRPPIPPKPCGVNLLVMPFSKKPRYNEDSEGSVNYHDLNLFQNVNKEQHIADYTPPEPGVPGVDIFGRRIPVEEVSNRPVQVGKGVVFDEISGKYYAIEPGYLTYEDHRLQVESTYFVIGDV